MLRRCLSVLVVFAFLAAPAMGAGYLEDFAKDFDGVTEKLNSLADAFDADQYGWRPAEGIRSVSESIVHVATTNFFLANRLGVAMPEDIGRDAEQTITAKKDVMALLARSQEHVRKAMEAAKKDGLDGEVELFGGQRTRRAVLMRAVGHNYEHLGQLIAYARSTDVVPPWSRPAS